MVDTNRLISFVFHLYLLKWVVSTLTQDSTKIYTLQVTQLILWAFLGFMSYY